MTKSKTVSENEGSPVQTISDLHVEELSLPGITVEGKSMDGKHDLVIDLDIASDRKEVKRVVLWTAPRSLSTAFERCMTRVPNAKIFNEMYAAAFLLGPERKKQWWPKLTPMHSYKYCKERMEADHPGCDFVFAKDFALEMHHHTEMLPKGYHHTFLIRHPKKVFSSLRKMLCNSLVLKTLSFGAKIKRCFPTDGYFYQDMWELYSFIRDHPDHPMPIILDADDIVKDPEAMIRKYCETIGLEFHPDILKWEKAAFTDLPWEGPQFFRFMNWLVGCYKNALNSTGFIKGGFKKSTKADKDDGKNSPTNGGNVDISKVEAGTSMIDSESGERTVVDSGSSGAGQSSRLAWVEGADTNGNSEKPSVKTPEGDDKDSATDGANETPEASDDLDLSGLHPDVRKAVEFTLPFYKKLYECRVTLDDLK